MGERESELRCCLITRCVGRGLACLRQSQCESFPNACPVSILLSLCLSRALSACTCKCVRASVNDFLIERVQLSLSAPLLFNYARATERKREIESVALRSLNFVGASSFAFGCACCFGLCNERQRHRLPKAVGAAAGVVAAPAAAAAALLAVLLLLLPMTHASAWLRAMFS